MGHSNVRKKIRRRRVANLAAISRKYTVKNTTKSISPVVEHEKVCDLSNAITCPFTGHKFVPTNPHPVPTKYGVCITGYDWVEPEYNLWTIPNGGYKQPKCLRRYKKRKYSGEKWVINGAGGYMRVYDIKRHARNDFKTFFPKYPYNLPKMNKVTYMEKLVEHKTVKWERKNPKPAEMFEEDVKNWEKLRDSMIERFRNFVVSIYDKLPLTGRFKINHKGMATYQEELVAEIKDIDGEGHIVNKLDPKKSKLLKKAQDITNKVKAKKTNLVATNLRDHKRKTGRIILPKAA